MLRMSATLLNEYSMVWYGTIILFVGIRYSMRDLLSDLNNSA